MVPIQAGPVYRHRTGGFRESLGGVRMSFHHCGSGMVDTCDGTGKMNLYRCKGSPLYACCKDGSSVAIDPTDGHCKCNP
jgi:hypothetical protein